MQKESKDFSVLKLIFYYFLIFYELFSDKRAVRPYWQEGQTLTTAGILNI